MSKKKNQETFKESKLGYKTSLCIQLRFDWRKNNKDTEYL